MALPKVLVLTFLLMSWSLGTLGIPARNKGDSSGATTLHEVSPSSSSSSEDLVSTGGGEGDADISTGGLVDSNKSPAGEGETLDTSSSSSSLIPSSKDKLEASGSYGYGLFLPSALSSPYSYPPSLTRGATTKSTTTSHFDSLHPHAHAYPLHPLYVPPPPPIALKYPHPALLAHHHHHLPPHPALYSFLDLLGPGELLNHHHHHPFSGLSYGKLLGHPMAHHHYNHHPLLDHYHL